MVKEKFKTTINASKQKVWDVLWTDETYRLWTKPFSEGSHAKSDWKEGSKILFLDGKNSGMVSEIASKKEPDFMSFRHLGIVKKGIEDLESEDIKEWAGALEEYTLKTVDGKTELTVEMDITDDFLEMFNAMWPKALQKLKELSEN